MRRSARGALAVVAGLLLPACNVTYVPDQNLPGGVTSPPFILVIPLDGELQAITQPQFAWNAYPGAVRYQLEISTAADFSQVVWEDSSLTITSTFLTQVTLTNFTTYFWRIHAILPSGPPVLAGGSPFQFRTQGGGFTSPLPFATQAPPNGSAGMVVQPLFTWFASVGATSYRLEIDTDSGFPAPVVLQPGIHVNRFQLATPLAANTRYYWRIFATGQIGNRYSDPPVAFFDTAP